MTAENESLILSILKRIQGDISGLSERILNMELRQTAVEHQLLGVNTHLSALQHSADSLAGDVRRVKQRLELVEE